MTVNEHPMMIDAKGLTKSYGSGGGRVQVLHGLDLAVSRGEFVAIMGPSGCGKTTLLNTLGLLTRPDTGQLSLLGKPADGSERQRHHLRQTTLGFVFQRLNLLRGLNARDNIRVALRVRGLKDSGTTVELMTRLGVADLACRKPSQMSIGQQQRVAIARALVHQPAILLADEPTGNLDSENTASLLEMLGELNRKSGQTIVMITHSPQVADAATRVVYMNDGVICENT